jgi:hypothetical protein
VDLTEREVANGVNSDKEQIRVSRMKRDEVANIGLKPAHLLTARVERMKQADLISLPARRRISCALRECHC